ncbi:hypothetical protein DPMN_144535 [Dreissena polymorpha]|uniref:Uncharacterized protein n=1 Tax=Dreissena polymorpha TaxID=45954 RepID=A0A9D4GF66_DREPO|nr:hypothetical protein DPMN_144535 [Dreissena polymorpha]
MFFKTDSVFEKKTAERVLPGKRAPVQWGVTHEQVCIAEYCKVGGVAVRPTGK